jgi:uncharacterized surface protein with fasciclin (FAS1) repeats
LSGLQTIQADPNLSTFGNAVTVQPAIVQLLEQPGQIYTLFVPDNATLASVPQWGAISADPDALMSFVRKNTVSGSYTVAQLFALPPGTVLTNLDNEPLVIDPLTQTINGARITNPDVQSSNGYVQTVDAPLVLVEPPATTTSAPAAPEAPTGTSG